MTWSLVDQETGAPVKVGERVTTWRGELFTLAGLQPPRHSASEGHVYLTRPCTHTADEHETVHWCKGMDETWPYASVIGARYVTADEPWCNHDAPAVRDGVCECGTRV